MHCIPPVKALVGHFRRFWREVPRKTTLRRPRVPCCRQLAGIGAKAPTPLRPSDVVPGFVFAGADARLVLFLCFLDEFLSGHRTHGIGVGVRAD